MTTIEFVHPCNHLKLKKIKEPNSLKPILNSQKIRKPNKQPDYKILKSGQEKIAAKCKQNGCPAFIKYSKINGQYILSKMNTTHIHQKKTLDNTNIKGFKISNQNTSKTLKQKIEQIMNNKNKQIKPQEILSRQLNKDDQFTKSKYQQQKQENILDAQQININQIKSFLKKNKFNFQCKFVNTENQKQAILPHILLFANEDMIKQFHHYGCFCSIYIDHTININNYLHKQNQGMQYKLMMFCGINAGFHIIDFAYGIVQVPKEIVQVSKYKLKYKILQAMIEQFFKLMKNQKPQTFIIQQKQEALLKAVGKIQKKYKVNYIFDSSQIAKKIKDQQNNSGLNQQQAKICQKIIKAKNIKQYSKYIQHALQNVKNNKLLIKLLQKAKRICFSEFNPQKISGYQNIQFSINFSLRSLLQKIFKNFKNNKVSYAQVINLVKTLIRVQLKKKCHIFERQQIPYQQFFQLPQLQYLRTILQMSIFRRLISNISQAFSINAILINQNQGIVQYLNIQNNMQKWRVLKKENENRWQCECCYSNKQGLPCCHEVKICLISNSLLSYQIHKRWMKMQEVCEQFKNKIANNITNKDNNLLSNVTQNIKQNNQNGNKNQNIDLSGQDIKSTFQQKQKMKKDRNKMQEQVQISKQHKIDKNLQKKISVIQSLKNIISKKLIKSSKNIEIIDLQEKQNEFQIQNQQNVDFAKNYKNEDERNKDINNFYDLNNVDNSQNNNKEYLNKEMEQRQKFKQNEQKQLEQQNMNNLNLIQPQQNEQNKKFQLSNYPYNYFKQQFQLSESQESQINFQ